MTEDGQPDVEMQRVGFEVEKDTYERAKEKLEYGQLSEEMRMLMNKIAYGTKTTQREKLREELEDLRSDAREKDREIESLREDKKEIRRKIERVEQQLDSIHDTESEYNGALEMLESDLHSGERIFVEMDSVESAATVGEKPKSEVIGDLMERNPDVPPFAFEVSSPHEPTDWREV